MEGYTYLLWGGEGGGAQENGVSFMEDFFFGGGRKKNSFSMWERNLLLAGSEMFLKGGEEKE